MDMFHFYNWTSIAVIHDSFPKSVFYSQVADYLRQAAVHTSTISLNYLGTDSSKKVIPYETLLLRARELSRGNSDTDLQYGDIIISFNL